MSAKFSLEVSVTSLCRSTFRFVWMSILPEDMQRIVQYISLNPDRFPDLLECQTLTQTDVTHGRPLTCY